MTLDLFFEDFRVATLREGSAGIELAYDPAWLARPNAFPISLSMPLVAEAYGAEKILPWLANLLPESHLSEIGQLIGVSPQDVIGLIRRMGRDTAGAISIGAPRGDCNESRIVGGEAQLERIIEELPHRPFLVGDEGVSMSLAGAQEKLGVVLVDGEIAIPLNGSASTHILKPDIRRLPGSVQNEAFCLTLARLVGLDAARVTTGVAGARSYLLVERFDRQMTPHGVGRIHQEDLAQTLGVFPKDKYEFGSMGEKIGPGLRQLFNAVAERISPGARLSLLDDLIFNVAVGNSDAHAKNYAILIGAGGTTKLAPIYDVLSGLVWPRVTKLLPQAINSQRDPANLQGADWQALAKEIGLSPARTVKRVEAICGLVKKHADEALGIVASMPAGGHPIMEQACHEAKKRGRRLLRQLAGSSITKGDNLTEDDGGVTMDAESN
ncbi:type II toxin-antitoxin system HipA family toxin [Rhodoblastus sp. 17X3]|uniref:type II toxin-antitoxin system HipA family toxin n=1 Tax=Rhodoblastus sp. 17X3 TaxID=3047026 RepID=UPI0024B81F9C|nr:type II toxin-antitoxin system HipA family toxin [Rhodoblastus sp. 17X3]MDI9849510.1 type II toxin-antitoxin system HipA family toxin [Rhodoblastus sp. 17X3]